MQAGWDFLLHALASLPPWLGAVLVGWAVSAGLTQAVKFLFPLAWWHGMREQLTRALAILSAAATAAAAHRALGGPEALALLVAIGAGLWSPLAFALLQAALRRWAPWAADVLSGDVRSTP